MKAKILLDLDGVIVDWLTAAIHTCGINPNIDLLSQEYGIEQIISRKHLWGMINSDPKWWDKLSVFPWSRYFVDELSKIENADLCFLTKPVQNGYCPAGKQRWILKHFGPDAQYLIGPSKHFCASPNSILIDDSPINCKKFEEYGGNVVLFKNTYLELKKRGFYDDINNPSGWEEEGHDDVFSSKNVEKILDDMQEEGMLLGGYPTEICEKIMLRQKENDQKDKDFVQPFLDKVNLLIEKMD